ncbi:uncharacterized protein LOC100181404 [Ciona intestinalis]
MDCITVDVVRQKNEPWGVQVTGESPCYIARVKPSSPAEEAGMQVGDCIFSVNGVTVHDASHNEVVQLISESGRVARFKLLPVSNEVSKPEPDDSAFWTSAETRDDRNQRYSHSDESDEELAFDHTNYEQFCKMFDEKTKVNGANKEFSLMPKYGDDDDVGETEPKTIDQSSFIITREDQKNFDANYELECTFKGKKASAAGAFTGDHNVILAGSSLEEVRGVRARVRAGIQHFSFGTEQEKIDPNDKGTIIVYTTSLGIYRSVAQQCEQARKILKGYRVKFQDRDIFNSQEHKDELYKRLGLGLGDPFPEMPRVYIDGVYIGGAGELQVMSDCGDLRIRLQEFPKYNIRSKCPTCEGTGDVICHSCKGRKSKKKNRFVQLKCSTCRQKGILQCPDCLS